MKFPVTVIISSCLFLLSSCGGGSSGGSNSNLPSETNSSENYNHSVINQNFQGSLFIDDGGGYIDLNSGNAYQLIPNDSNNRISPSKDGSEYVQTIYRARNLPGALSGWNDRIIIRDMQSDFALSSFEIRESIVGPAKLSPDRQFVAAIWQDESQNESVDEDRLTVFSRDGQIISRSMQQDIYHFDWLPDGRLIFASLSDRSLYLSDNPNSTQASLLKTFSSDEGQPGWVRSSSDGEKIAFELVSEFAPSPFSSWRHATIWTMNLNGTELTKIATDNRDKPLLNTPVWSPDNQWLGLLQGSKSGISFIPDPIQSNIEVVSVNGIAGAFFVVDSTGENQLVPDNTSTVKPIFKLLADDQKNFLRTSYDSDLLWLPTITQTISNAGSLPQSNQPHHGLSGAFYFANSAEAGIEASNIDSFNLANANTQVQFPITEDDTDYINDLIYISEDKQWVSHYFDDTFNPELRIYDSSGSLQIAFPLEASNDVEIIPTNRIQFSPVNSDLVLLPYKYYQDGWQNKAMILNWRTGNIVKAFLNEQYQGSEWTREGHVLLTARDSGDVYKSTSINGSYSEPSILFNLPDSVTDLALNPRGDRLAIEMIGGIWTIDLNGTNLRRLTARGRYFYTAPEWSPDGQFIALKAIDASKESLDLGDLWIVAADAENVAIHFPFNSPNAIPLLDKENEAFDIFGSYSWR